MRDGEKALGLGPGVEAAAPELQVHDSADRGGEGMSYRRYLASVGDYVRIGDSRRNTLSTMFSGYVAQVISIEKSKKLIARDNETRTRRVRIICRERDQNFSEYGVQTDYYPIALAPYPKADGEHLETLAAVCRERLPTTIIIDDPVAAMEKSAKKLAHSFRKGRAQISMFAQRINRMQAKYGGRR
jgi:hypothetical protein